MKERASNVAEYTVSEISQAVKGRIEDAFGHVRVRGEITGFKGRHSSGHAYLGLKDENACVDAVIWRSTYQRLKVKPEMGLEVVATGRLTTFARASKYQLVVESLEPAGAGALLALLEARRKALEAEGLFARERKRPLPYLPRVVGVVTSPTGAVIRDILHRIADRFPVHVVVWPVRVQGETCAAEVAAGVAGFGDAEAHGLLRPDVVIVARGGGSMEDLWGYNEEIVVRAAAASPVPIVSAVGHETDWTLIDLAADARAPTPTGAAEMAVPVRSELMATVADRARRLEHGAIRLLESRRDRVRGLARGLPSAQDLLGPARQRLDAATWGLEAAMNAATRHARQRLDRAAHRISPSLLARQIAHARASLSGVEARLGTAARNGLARRGDRLSAVSARLVPELAARRNARAAERLAAARDRLGRAEDAIVRAETRRLAHAAQLLSAFSYHAVLKRGFALVRDSDGVPVRSAGAVAPGAVVSMEFHDGRVAARALDGAGGPAPAADAPDGPEATHAPGAAAAEAGGGGAGGASARPRKTAGGRRGRSRRAAAEDGQGTLL